jgi:ribose transport system ATP-binding protein
MALPDMNPPPLIEMRGIGKKFPGVVASDHVDFTLASGEIVGLLGENGAGKSTLMKMLGGVYQPDEGEILIEGQPVTIRNVVDSQKLGIAFIHQELNVLDNLDIAGNVFLGREPLKAPFRRVDQKRMVRETGQLLQRLGLELPADTPLARLSIAQRQLVEIAKALSLNARVIIMDEPTSSLSLSETDKLLECILELKRQGVSIIYISHRLGEVEKIADRAVVLRDGRNAGELSRGEITHDRMVRLMVGREIRQTYVKSDVPTESRYFRVHEVRSQRFPQHAVSFEATRGELAEAIFGVRAADFGSMELGGHTFSVGHTREAIQHGIYLIPEDRRQTGLITSMTVRENVTLASTGSYVRSGLIHTDLESEVAQRYRGELSIKAPSVESLVVNLSGGNQQKVVLAKWLSMDPKVLIFDEPTRGIDVGAKAEIYRIMRQLADAGIVVIMISSDMEEVLALSDRIAVMNEGRITGILDRADCNEVNIMRLAVGGSISALNS